MNNPPADDERPLDPAQAKIVAKVRWLMALSGLATVLGIAVVVGVIGYRVFRSDGSITDVTALIPKGARIVATSVTDARIAVTLETAGTVEIRTFDTKTLRPVGRLKFANDP
ncbi:MAG: hypothetical protein HY056_03935 [Proteobacteria bacterium]|nr:hypothetical protein [Pseudomonadota bacterium]